MTRLVPVFFFVAYLDNMRAKLDGVAIIFRQYVSLDVSCYSSSGCDICFLYELKLITTYAWDGYKHVGV